tara:strand:+ start:221 stop:1381 length:1161 start_codon:yes stop_codon:yes gene_type:complete
MKIAIDVTYSPSGGSLTQIRNMIDVFNGLDDLKIVIYSKKDNNKLLSDVTKNNKVIISSLANLAIIGRVLWGQLFLPLYLKKDKIDILFCPGNLGPVFSPIKTVIWVGTIGPFFKDFYENLLWTSLKHNKAKLYLNKFFMIASTRRASAVIYESNYTKNLFEEKFNLNKSTSHVINIGFDNFFADCIKSDYESSELNSISKTNYVLCVSHMYPYKNIIRLLVAYRLVIDTTQNSSKLIIAGSRHYAPYNNEIEQCIDDLSLNDYVVLLGEVSKKVLKNLYLDASMLVFPSPFENFAYTLVEAMSCGVPIVCSNTTAMTETCHNAAQYFNPYNINEMAEKIGVVLVSDDLRNEMSKKSILRSKELPNYHEVAHETIDIMREIVNEQN